MALARWQVSFFSHKKACHIKRFCLGMMKNCQHQHKSKPYTQEKSQGAAISVEDAITIIRGLNLCGVHCSLLWSAEMSASIWYPGIPCTLSGNPWWRRHLQITWVTPCNRGLPQQRFGNCWDFFYKKL
jgi:hypothetical protein